MIINQIANSIACAEAILSLAAFAEDAAEELGAPDEWTSKHIHEQWTNVIFAFPPVAEA